MIKTVGTIRLNYFFFRQGIQYRIAGMSAQDQEKAQVFFSRFRGRHSQELEYDTDDLFVVTEGFTQHNLSFVLGWACANFYIKKQLEA